jgi:hypothetical protein
MHPCNSAAKALPLSSTIDFLTLPVVEHLILGPSATSTPPLPLSSNLLQYHEDPLYEESSAGSLHYQVSNYSIWQDCQFPQG